MAVARDGIGDAAEAVVVIAKVAVVDWQLGILSIHIVYSLLNDDLALGLEFGSLEFMSLSGHMQAQNCFQFLWKRHQINVQRRPMMKQPLDKGPYILYTCDNRGRLYIRRMRILSGFFVDILGILTSSSFIVRCVISFC